MTKAPHPRRRSGGWGGSSAATRDADVWGLGDAIVKLAAEIDKLNS